MAEKRPYTPRDERCCKGTINNSSFTFSSSLPSLKVAPCVFLFQDLLYCFVKFPRDADLSTVECLPKLSVSEVVVERWAAKGDREAAIALALK
jgi:hypothetical protein